MTRRGPPAGRQGARTVWNEATHQERIIVRTRPDYPRSCRRLSRHAGRRGSTYQATSRTAQVARLARLTLAPAESGDAPPLALGGPLSSTAPQPTSAAGAARAASPAVLGSLPDDRAPPPPQCRTGTTSPRSPRCTPDGTATDRDDAPDRTDAAPVRTTSRSRGARPLPPNPQPSYRTRDARTPTCSSPWGQRSREGSC